MAYYADLTPYEYDGDVRAMRARLDEVSELYHFRPHIEALLDAVNIGWISPTHPYPTGHTPSNSQTALLRFCLDPPWGHRGYHYCGLGQCSGSSRPLRAGQRDANIYLGDGVIIVPGSTRTYAAPSLIYHYVVAHGYRPPDEFIDAVLASTPPVTHRSRTGKLGFLAFLRKLFG